MSDSVPNDFAAAAEAVAAQVKSSMLAAFAKAGAAPPSRAALEEAIGTHILDEGANECSCKGWEHFDDPYDERIATFSTHVTDALLELWPTPPQPAVAPGSVTATLLGGHFLLTEARRGIAGGTGYVAWCACGVTFEQDAETLHAVHLLEAVRADTLRKTRSWVSDHASEAIDRVKLKSYLDAELKAGL